MSSIDLLKVKQNIYNWIKSLIDEGLITSVTASQVIWREGSKPLPARPCVTLKIISGPRRTGLSDAFSLKDSANEIFNVGGQRAFTLSVQVFGTSVSAEDQATTIAEIINASLDRPTVRDLLRAGIVEGPVRKGSIAVWSVGGVEDFSALEETEFEDRAQFDVIFGVAENIEDQPGVIETVNFTTDTTS